MRGKRRFPALRRNSHEQGRARGRGLRKGASHRARRGAARQVRLRGVRQPHRRERARVSQRGLQAHFRGQARGGALRPAERDQRDSDRLRKKISAHRAAQRGRSLRVRQGRRGACRADGGGRFLRRRSRGDFGGRGGGACGYSRHASERGARRARLHGAYRRRGSLRPRARGGRNARIFNGKGECRSRCKDAF